MQNAQAGPSNQQGFQNKNKKKWKPYNRSGNPDNNQKSNSDNKSDKSLHQKGLNYESKKNNRDNTKKYGKGKGF